MASTRNPRVIIRQMDREMAGRVVRLAANVHSELVQGTPVDTNWARANWVPGLTARKGTVGTRPKRKGKKEGNAPIFSSGEGQAGLAAILLGYKSLKQGAVWVVNNVPYIRVLDAKHRRAKGFVQRAIRNALLKTARITRI